MASGAILALADTGTAAVAAEWAADAVQLQAWLDDRYDIALVLLDTALADAGLLARLQRAGAPRAIFLTGATADGITLSPNVVAYVERDDAAGLQAAIALALAEPGIAVGDFSDRDAQRLNSLGREVERIARALSELATASQAEAVAGRRWRHRRSAP